MGRPDLSVTILVDPAVWPYRGHLWAHLVSDHSYEELHAFASRLGIERARFQGDHYDVPADLRAAAIAAGAVPVSARELVHRLRAAGLRQRSKIARLPGEAAARVVRPDQPPPGVYDSPPPG